MGLLVLQSRGKCSWCEAKWWVCLFCNLGVGAVGVRKGGGSASSAI